MTLSSQQMVQRLRQQQALLAAFGSFAFRETNLLSVLNEAARVCALSLNVTHAKICQYRPVQNDLMVVAGFGWDPEIVGQVVSQANETSPQGRAYVTAQPVICHDLNADSGFNLADFYSEHGIVSTIDVIVKGLDGPPFGVLEIDSTTLHVYDEYDVNFLTGFANVLAEAVATAERVDKLRHAMIRMQNLVDEKDQLLADKSILAEELQHRVRNNLQLVTGMLAAQLRQSSDPHDRNGLRGIQSRVTALAKVYDQLLGVGLTRAVDFGEYARLLCDGLLDLQVTGAKPVAVSCDVASMVLDLNIVTVLGLAVTELVANSYKHAFPDREGRIAITGGASRRPGWGSVSVTDDGIGYIRTERESKRHGVGLVYRLLEQLSGSVEVHVANGTTWTLIFPLSAETEEVVS